MNENKVESSGESVRYSNGREWTPEQRAPIFEQARAEFDSEATEAELKELLDQREKGLLLSGEEILAMAEELCQKHEQEQKVAG